MIARPGPAPAPAPTHLEVRPGLVLGWGPTPPAGLPPRAAGIRCQLEPVPGRMRLLRTTSDCAKPDVSPPPVVIYLEPSAADELLTGDPSAGATALRRYLAATGEAARAPGFETPLSPLARLALESIRRCPFVGVCRTMALTARCHDLLVEFLTAWTTALQPAPTTAPGPAAGVRLAAEILERNLERPPSLAELAARVGLSETTLKRAFPRVFGTTVFGYLRRRRMEEARRLLDRGEATVLEAALRVGYSNPSNFAAAFRREFGLNPKSHQLAHRR